jgi:hypothetical protein
MYVLLSIYRQLACMILAALVQTHRSKFAIGEEAEAIKNVSKIKGNGTVLPKERVCTWVGGSTRGFHRSAGAFARCMKDAVQSSVLLNK